MNMKNGVQKWFLCGVGTRENKKLNVLLVSDAAS